MDVKPLYSVPELAQMTGLSRQQVGRLLAKHDVPIMRIGRKVLVPLSCLKTAFPWAWDSVLEARYLQR